MEYPIAIEPGNNDQAWSVVVPDLPGCFSAADDGIDQAIESAKEAIELWIETAIDDGQPVATPTHIADHRANPAYAGWVWAIVDVDPAVMDDTAERINITLPRRILKRLDDRARAAGASRSGFIAQLAVNG